MPSSKKKDACEVLEGDKDALSKSEMAQTKPQTKDFDEFLSLFTQNPKGLAAFFTRLHKFMENHPDAEGMTLDEFIKAHPDTWGAAAVGTIITNTSGNQLSILDATELENEIKTLTHIPLPTTALTNFLKQFMNNPTRIESSRKGRISIEEHYLTKDTIITYKGEGAEYTIGVERVKELFTRRVQNGAEIFNFLLQKLNEQNYQEKTEFLLSELVDAGYGTPRPLSYITPKLYCATACPCSAAFRYHSTA